MSKATSGSSIETEGAEQPGGIPYLASFLGYQNVFFNGEPWSYSQQGDFTAVQWDVLGESINVLGPNPDFPLGKIVKRHWDIHNKLLIFGFNGQSNDVGATGNEAGVEDPVTPFMQLAPIPNVLKAYTGGFTPTQGGVNAPTVGEIIDPAQYADLVAGHENINTGRVGEPVNRQMWSSAFGQVIAAAVPSDNVVLVINVGHGSTSFAEDVRIAAIIDSASWLAGVVTFVFREDTMIVPGAGFNVKVASPSAYQGLYTAITSDGITVTAAKVSDPGAFVSGYALVASAPMVNMRTMVQYAVDTIAPALGLTPEFCALGYNGNESADDTLGIANYAVALSDLRTLVNELGAICSNPAEPYIVWPQVGWPIASWRVQNPTLPETASMVALGALAYSRDPAQKLITFPMYATVAGGLGDSNAVACIHYGVQGHFDNGERGANLFLDKVADSLDVEPLQLEYGENVLVRVANSTTVTGAFNKAATIDTTIHITDPGNAGVQFYSGVSGSGTTFGGGNGLEDPIDAVDIDGTTAFEATLGGLPALSWGNWVGVAYNNATIYLPQNGTLINNATWADGVATYTTVTPHGLVEGDTATAFIRPDAWNVQSPPQPALAGTSGTTLKLALAADGGLVPILNATWLAGVATFTVGITLPEVEDFGYQVTVSGVTPSGYNGLLTVIARGGSPYMQFTVDMPVDPGPYVSGGGFVGYGSIINNGAFGIGRVEGLRSQIRETTGTHYSTSTGARLEKMHAIQFAPVDVYPSMKSIEAMLVELGMASDFELVLDFGNTDCYGGSTNQVTNLGTSAATNDFWLGLSNVDATRTPTFNGSAGALDRTNFFSAAADGKIFTPQTTTDIFADIHKAGGQGTIIVGLQVPAGLPANVYQFATCQVEGGGTQGPGFGLRVGTTNVWSVTIKGDASATTYARNSTLALPTDTFALLALGIEDGNNKSWMYTYDGSATTTAAGFETFTPTFVSPSANAAQSDAYIWQNGSTGTVRSRTGCQIFFMLGSNTFMTKEQAMPLMRGLWRRQIMNLPA